MATAIKKVPIPRNGVDYRGKIVLAPMVRSGECPSRLLALKYGADLVWGPETIDKALIGTTRRVNSVTGTIDFTRQSSNAARNLADGGDCRESIIYRVHPEKEGRRLIYQIGTANPDTAVEAAKLIAPDVAGIDVNAGCPKPFSTSGGMGAALLKTPERLCSVLRALVKNVGEPNEIGISVKIRILDSPAETESLVRQLCTTGITGLTVHCRTPPMRPRERAIRDQLQMIATVCRDAGVACLMNGDVTSRDEAKALVAEYGVDGAMIATAAETNPSCFRQDSEGGKAPWQDVVKEYVSTAMDVENRWGNTKYLLGQMIPGKAPAYRSMTQTKCYSELVKSMEYGADFEQRAARCDEVLRIGDFEKPKPSKAERKAASKAAAQNSAAKKIANTASMTTGSLKRTAEMAGLEATSDATREFAPGTVSEQTSPLVV